MQRILLLVLLAAMTTTLQAQASKEKLQSGITASIANKSLLEGYVCSNGLLLKAGDTLSLGQGSNPNHSYSFIYESYSNFFGSSDDKRIYLKTGQTNKAIIKRFKLFGNKKIGFTCVAIVSVGLTSRYFVDIENAITYHEVMSPEQLNSMTAAPVLNQDDAVINQIKKWKGLLDDGAITQEEYDRKKKELLGS